MAQARCVSPVSSSAHSWGPRMRGTRSTSNGRCSPWTTYVRSLLRDPGVPGLGALGELGGSVGDQGRHDVPVGRARDGPGAQGLVACPHAVAAQGRQGRSGVRGLPVALGDDEPHHVLEAAPLGVGGALPIGGVAAGQHRLGQLGDGLPVAELLELRPQPVHEVADHLGGGPRGRAGAAVDEVAGEPAAGGLPDRGAMQRGRGGGEGPPGLDVELRRPHHAAEDAGDEDDVVDQRAGVADAQLEGRGMRGGPDVEVDHLGVADDAGPDEVGHELVVLGRGGERAGRARRGPPLPDDGADAGVAGVEPVPVGRAGRERQQHGQVGSDPLDDLHGEVAVGDPDVDLRAADQLLVHQQPVLLLHLAVAPGAGQLEVGVGRAGQRCRPRRCPAPPARRRR